MKFLRPSKHGLDFFFFFLENGPWNVFNLFFHWLSSFFVYSLGRLFLSGRNIAKYILQTCCISVDKKTFCSIVSNPLHLQTTADHLLLCAAVLFSSIIDGILLISFPLCECSHVSSHCQTRNLK